MRKKTLSLLGILFLLLQITSRAQMLDPAIDRAGEPFSYFSKPTDVLGVMDGRWGTLVSPEGFLYTGYGELMFFAGNPPRPIEQREKTLLRGGIGLQRWSKGEVWQEWAADGALSAVLVPDFGPGGGDPGEKCFTLSPTGSEGITTAVFWGEKGNSGQNEERERIQPGWIKNYPR